MITAEQEKWLAHLNDSDSVKIYPVDLKANDKFEKIKKQIQSVLGQEINVEHCGATSLGISGQGELDIYIPISPDSFDKIINLVINIFGKPGSLYPLERARFATTIDNTKTEVFVINEKSKGWVDCCRFEKYLKENPKILKDYERLKHEGQGMSTQKYYRRKVEFINNVLKQYNS